MTPKVLKLTLPTRRIQYDYEQALLAYIRDRGYWVKIASQSPWAKSVWRTLIIKKGPKC